MSNTYQLLIWIYENHHLINMEDAPFGSGDMDALEEGIQDLVESLFSWKEKHKQYFEIDLLCDVTEEGAGILKCFDAMTGEPRPFPSEWLRDNEGKTHVLNDPQNMDPLLKIYSNPWKHMVQCIFTKENAATPPECNLDEGVLKEKEELEAKQQKIVLSAMESLVALGIPLKEKWEDAKDVLEELIKNIHELDN